MLWEWSNTGNQVFILDLDGTMMSSAEVDDSCFWQAVRDCCGKPATRPDLHGFKNVTDSGILNEWFQLELARPPRPEETHRIRQRFLDLLKAAWKSQPGHFEPLPGVVAWLEAVQSRSNVFAGIATGGWGPSARLKLELAGLDRFDIPLASSDEAVPRADIMRIAARRTFQHQAEDDAVFTYVGDGPWDLEASQKLDWNFIGIASGKRAEQLRKAGATHVHVNFLQ